MTTNQNGSENGSLSPPSAPDAAAARRREKDRAYCRARRAARLAAGQCVECGVDRDAVPGGTSNFCARCAARARDRVRGRLIGRIASDSPENVPPPAPDSPQCPACGSGAVRKCGILNGRQRYQCRVCGRGSYGQPPPPDREPLPCPYCGANCIKHGKSPLASGRVRQRYQCSACGRINTGLWPATPRAPGGPFRRRKTFDLDMASVWRLNDYCNARGISPAHALRDILAEQARPPVMAAARRVVAPDGRVEIETESWTMSRPPLNLNVRLPNVGPETTRRMASQTDRAYHNPLFIITYRISLRMNDLAWEGLLRAMERLGKNHQETIRYLVRNARLPSDRPRG